MDPTTALVAASAAHAGFSVVITVVVYPALADVARESPRQWSTRHDAHSRRTGYVVAPLYLLVAAVCGWALVAGPAGWAWTALTGNAVAALVTAARAAPTHRRLGREGPDPGLVSRLLRADRLRTAAAVLAMVASVLAA